MGQKEECPKCGAEKEMLTTHWKMSNSCSAPSLDDRQKELLKGMLMSDGSVEKQGNYAKFSYYGTNIDYMKWLVEELGVFSNELRLSVDGKTKYDYSPDFYSEIPSDYYTFTVKATPEVKKFAEWYSTGIKKIPENIELTPEVCRAWYCGDGTLVWSEKWNQVNEIVIGCSNEKENLDIWDNKFQQLGFSSFIVKRGLIGISKESVKEFLEWLGKPPSGMSYKWEIDSLSDYRKMKKEVA